MTKTEGTFVDRASDKHAQRTVRHGKKRLCVCLRGMDRRNWQRVVQIAEGGAGTGRPAGEGVRGRRQERRIIMVAKESMVDQTGRAVERQKGGANAHQKVTRSRQTKRQRRSKWRSRWAERQERLG